MSSEKLDEANHLTRRAALGALALAGLVVGCGSSDDKPEMSSDAGRESGSKRDTGIHSASETGVGDADSCAATPEGEIGPYFADDSATGFKRSNIASNLDGTSTQVGVPLTLTVTVIDTKKGCAPYVGAQIDIWHCNASGVYSDISGEETPDDQWLRGYQLTNDRGQVTFKTIIPGWYSGRTTHIHLRVRSSYSDASSTTDGTNTTQCFFVQAFIDALYTSVAPYSAKGTNPTTNAGDRVYSQQEDGANVLALAGSQAKGYTAAVTIYLPITASYDASTPAGGAMGGAPGDGGFVGDGAPGGGPPGRGGSVDGGRD